MKLMAWVGIVVFVVLALNETVFGRTAKEAYQLNLQPFWSYEAIMNGRKDLIKEHFSALGAEFSANRGIFRGKSEDHQKLPQNIKRTCR